VKLQLAEAQRRVLGAQLQSPPQKVALVMDGKVLAILLERKHRKKLLLLGIQCSAVICCRVSPLQKAQITRWAALLRPGAQGCCLWEFRLWEFETGLVQCKQPRSRGGLLA